MLRLPRRRHKRSIAHRESSCRPQVESMETRCLMWLMGCLRYARASFHSLIEQVGEPSPLLGSQARNEAGEGVGVRLILVFSATSSATSGRRRKLRLRKTVRSVAFCFTRRMSGVRIPHRPVSSPRSQGGGWPARRLARLGGENRPVRGGEWRRPASSLTGPAFDRANNRADRLNRKRHERQRRRLWCCTDAIVTTPPVLGWTATGCPVLSLKYVNRGLSPAKSETDLQASLRGHDWNCTVARYEWARPAVRGNRHVAQG